MATTFDSTGRTRLATKLSGYGNVPGQKTTGGKTSTSYGGLSSGYFAQGGTPAPPTFTASIPAAPAQAQAQAGTGPQLSTASSGGGVAHGDPRDPTYWTDVAKIHNTFGTNEASYNLQETQGRTKLTDTLAQYDKQEPIDIGNTRGSYNNAGLFYSTRLGGATTDIVSKYGEARNSANAGFKGLTDQLAILRNQNQNENGVDAQGNLTGTNYLDALNAGIGRSSAADQALAEQNILAGLNPDGSPKAQDSGGGDVGGNAGPAPGSVVNGQFQSQILNPNVVSAINQWIKQANSKPRVVSSSAQRTTGR
jgi:hypothetical protein